MKQDYSQDEVFIYITRFYKSEGFFRLQCVEQIAVDCIKNQSNIVLKYKWAPTRSNKCLGRLSFIMDLVSGLYWNINTVSSDHLRLLDGLISMPTSTGKQRRLIRYVSRQEGALLFPPPQPLNHKASGGN